MGILNTNMTQLTSEYADENREMRTLSRMIAVTVFQLLHFYYLVPVCLEKDTYR